MPSSNLTDDPFVAQQMMTHDVSVLEGSAIAVDATYFIQQMLDHTPSHEPLMCALAGLTGIHMHLENELNQWKAHKVTPLFIFEGLPVAGQDDVTIQNGLRDIQRTNAAWDLYFAGSASEAVAAFGATGSTFRAQSLYPLLQRLLRKRKLHFLIVPYNASAQIAYFDMINSDQCGGIMGSPELLLYPIHDGIINAIDWNQKRVHALSKKQLVRSLGVSESLFTDALLLTGTSSLPTFPPLRDVNITPRPLSVADATNMLRTAEKNVASLCASFNDLLQAQDPQWLDKYRKARMAVSHFIYIAESGEICVNDFDRLTSDNHEYLGFQLPAELFHYLNKGLISPRVPSWIAYCRVTILPTLDGYVADEYKTLVTQQLVPYYETALALILNRINRGFNFQEMHLKVWYDAKFSLKLKHRGEDNNAVTRIAAWNATDASLNHFPRNDNTPAAASPGSIAFELSALNNKDFVAETLKAPKTHGVENADTIVSLTLWRLLTLRGYIEPKTLEPTKVGVALGKAFAALEPVVKKHPELTASLHAAALLAFDLIRLDLLNAKNQHAELQGYPANGPVEDRDAAVLISRVATLLPLRQDTSGYTGPLSKSLLAFHTLTTTVGEANRAIIESLLALTFMSNQANRDRVDFWDIGHRLPFIEFPDAALGIAVKTFLDESFEDNTPEEKEARKQAFPAKFVPHATHPFEDIEIAFGLVEALHAGVQTLGEDEIKGDVKAEWERAKKYLDRRK
ncbi:xpg i-region protein [Sporothrix brasiliensis 5110]|uniref:Xpg i-region protein n=1 Tax=Sporothrix brasiliensis 5110 TaxID=1398154 RepID=A0A0C2FBC0_9PEZI|nr:xpg i-region protein [Sporothrix brasiliensis 5110]KIH88373.1 xpg i-region protein [Sporothrix brasiliensis 5110]